MSMIFPDESQAFHSDLNCNEVGDRVVITTTKNTVEGVVSYSLGGLIKVRYDAEQAGFFAGYELGHCEIKDLKCYTCCEHRYIELPTCELTTSVLSNLIGPDLPEGKLFAYSGDLQEPDCMWVYRGFGNHLDPNSWTDEFGALGHQFSHMSEEQLAVFLSWLSERFDGRGVSFNPTQNTIVVATNGDGVGYSSFQLKYENGQVVLDPGDSSTPKIVQVVKFDGKPPSLPYDWFIYVDQSSGSVHLNVNGNPLLLGQLEAGDITTCESVALCLSDSLLNPPAPDEYAMPTAGLVINQVVYHDGSGSHVADFTACSTGATDLDDLTVKLNSCGANPSGWSWLNRGGVLTLCVSNNTKIIAVTHSGSQVINFNGVPTTPGEGGTDLCSAVVTCVRESGAGVADTELDHQVSIESAFASNQYVAVRWAGPDGNQRISYRDPVNNWFHPAFLSESTQTDYLDLEQAYDGQPYADVRWTDSFGVPRRSTKDPLHGWFHQALISELVVSATPAQVTVAGGISDNSNVVALSTLVSGIPVGARGLRVVLNLAKTSGNINQAMIVTAKASVTGNSEVKARLNTTTAYPTSSWIETDAEGVTMLNGPLLPNTLLTTSLAKVGSTQGAWTATATIKAFIL